LWDRLITTGRRGPWTPKEFGLEVVEGEVWGIDPYARRCVELALKEVPRSARLTDTVRAAGVLDVLDVLDVLCVTCCWLLVTGYLILVTGYWLLVTGYLLLVTCYLLLVTCNL
jgi:hypothetical protein